ncbi:velvet factor-domain-containing protein [Xylariales sp. AK1849]|nr:velvet factor-domain-containing protein [Xylariales sp. AK1849]
MATHMNPPQGEHQPPITQSVWNRRTRGGRTIHYQLTVLQQPERARACGSGPKSSADRRPVDPPPIVRLVVLEGEDIGNAKDVTMDYNSDFFLFVSLENARPMAHGRVQTPAATSPPVLTGVPVSACCYLDRPTPAGYFLFPDLSVRHEGRYKLIFRLYERNKDAQDLNMADPVDQPESLEDEDGLFFTFLNEVRSAAFTVFSAKKFPGLAESTPLSRTVAEQGCRVRIRRDVRMRRRDGKGTAQAEYEQREEEYAREPRTQSPADAYRNRSGSNSSMDRRPSGYDHQPPLAPNQRILSFAQPGYNKPYQPPPAPSEPVSPAIRTPGYRHPSFATPAYPSTPTYAHTYSERQPLSAHEERRPSLPYPSAGYGTPIQPRPVVAPIEPAQRDHRASIPALPPMKVLSSPGPSHHSSSHSLKRSFDAQGRLSTSEIDRTLEYNRAGGHVAFKQPPPYRDEPGYRGEEPWPAPIDPRLIQAEDQREEDLYARKRPYRPF